MLVLSRKIGEKIAIGDNITLTVLSIDHNKIRLGIDAPTEIPIIRDDAKRGEKNGRKQSVGSGVVAEGASVLGNGSGRA